MPIDDDADAALRLLRLGQTQAGGGEFELAADSFRRAAELGRKSGLIEAEVRARLGLARALQRLRRADEALRELEVSGSMAEVARDKVSQHEAAQVMAEVCLGQGRWEQGLTAARRALALARQLGEQAHQASALGMIGQLARRQGDLQASLDAALEGLEISQRIGHIDEELAFLGDLVLVALRKGEAPEAERLATRGLERARATDRIAQAATFLGQLCHATRAQGDRTRARTYATEGLEAARTAGDAREQAAFLQDLGELDEADGRLPEAVGRFEESLRILDRIGYREGLILGYRRLALLLVANREPKRGMAALAHAMVLAFPVDPQLFQETFSFVFPAFTEAWERELYDELLSGLEHVDQALTMAGEVVTRDSEELVALLRDTIETLSLLAESRGDPGAASSGAARDLAARVDAAIGIDLAEFVAARCAKKAVPPARPTGEPIH